MKIDISKIEGYDKMTAEEKVAALEALELEDKSKEIEEKENALQKYKDALSKANSEAAENKKKYKALLSEEERNAQERDEKYANLEKELAALKAEKQIAELKSQYLGLGYDEELASATAKAMAEGDMETVFANSKTFLDNHDKTVEANLLKGTPRPRTGASDNPKPITNEEFENMSYEEIATLKETSPEQYDALMGE